jgi:carbon storage regulator
MLVLSRKIGERVVIGRDIEICIVQIRGDRVRLGFEAPAQVVIQRSELRQQPVRTDGGDLRKPAEPDHAKKH